MTDSRTRAGSGCCFRNEKGPRGPTSRSPCTGDPPPVSWIARTIARSENRIKWRPENPAAAHTAHAKTVLQRQIDATDRQIDPGRRTPATAGRSPRRLAAASRGSDPTAPPPDGRRNPDRGGGGGAVTRLTRHLLYIDESGGHDLAHVDSNWPIFVLVGLLVVVKKGTGTAGSPTGAAAEDVCRGASPLFQRTAMRKRRACEQSATRSSELRVQSSV